MGTSSGVSRFCSCIPQIEKVKRASPLKENVHVALTEVRKRIKDKLQEEVFLFPFRVLSWLLVSGYCFFSTKVISNSMEVNVSCVYFKCELSGIITLPPMNDPTFISFFEQLSESFMVSRFKGFTAKQPCLPPCLHDSFNMKCYLYKKKKGPLQILSPTGTDTGPMWYDTKTFNYSLSNRGASKSKVWTPLNSSGENY